MNFEDRSLKVVILDKNIFITEVVEEILKNYDHELIKIKSIEECREACDFFIFTEESIDEDFIHRIALLTKLVRVTVLICNRKWKIPRKLIPYLGSIVWIDQIDEHLKELFDHYSFLKSDRTFQQESEMINKLIRDTEGYLSEIIKYFNYLKNALSKNPETDTSKLNKLQEIINIFRDEFTSFEHFNFIEMIPRELTDINTIIEEILKTRGNELKSKLDDVKFTPDFGLEEIYINPVVIRKLLNNLLSLILMATQNPDNLVISIKKRSSSVEIIFELECSSYEHKLFYQIFSPFFPRRILENYIINYFRIKIERYHKIFVRDLFTNNNLIFLIILEVED
jgi:signal transduction histidine kinase